MTRSSTGSWFLTVVALVCLVCLSSSGFAQSLSNGTNIGASTSAQPVTLKFPATGGPFTLSSINVVTQGAPNLDFAAAAGGTCAINTAYAALKTCIVNVIFTPKYPGLRMGAVVLRDSSSNALATAFISGIGNGPQVALLPGSITTVAGDGKAGFSGDGGPATSAMLDRPYNVTVDGAGNLYLNQGEVVSVIRKVDAGTQTISSVTGDIRGSFAYYGDTAPAVGIASGVPATDIPLNGPIWVTVDGAGNYYISDLLNNVIRKVDAASQIITTVVGSYPSKTNVVTNPGGYSGDGGPATQADGTPLNTTTAPFSPQINGAVGLTLDGAGNLYIADKGNNVIRKVDAVTQTITTSAGNFAKGGIWQGDNGPATSAGLWQPSDVAVDGAGNLYIADSANHVIRKVNASTQIITTVAGTGIGGYSPDGTLATSAKLNYPIGITVDAAGSLYFAENGNNIIRRVDAATQMITTVAGTNSTTGGYSGDGGPATSAVLNSPTGLALDAAGNLYFADSMNNVIRKVTASPASLTFPATGIGAQSAEQTVTASNIGNTSLQLTGTAITAAVNFKVDTTTSTCPVASLLPGASCTAKVYFAPTLGGALSDNLVFTDDSLNVTGAKQSAALSGSATDQAQTITFPNPGPQTYGVAPLGLTATATSGLAISYVVSSGPATVNGSTLTITGAGPVTVQATQPGNTNWGAATPVSVTFAVNQKGLTVTASNQTVPSGGTIPSLTYTITGFVNGETTAVVTGTPACTTTATGSSPVGSYPITCGGTLSATNYSFSFVAGSLFVAALPRVLTLPVTNIDPVTLTMNGVVNPNEAATTYWFEYSTKQTLASLTRTPSQTLPAGVTQTAVTTGLTGLAPHTVYYFRVVAQNSIGISQGQILNFRSSDEGANATASNGLVSPIGPYRTKKRRSTSL